MTSELFPKRVRIPSRSLRVEVLCLKLLSEPPMPKNEAHPKGRPMNGLDAKASLEQISEMPLVTGAYLSTSPDRADAIICVGGDLDSDGFAARAEVASIMASLISENMESLESGYFEFDYLIREPFEDAAEIPPNYQQVGSVGAH